MKTFLRVKANCGAAGIDGQSLAAFEAELNDDLYKLWNRFTSGCYLSPPNLATTASTHADPSAGTMQIIAIGAVTTAENTLINNVIRIFNTTFLLIACRGLQNEAYDGKIRRLYFVST